MKSCSIKAKHVSAIPQLLLAQSLQRSFTLNHRTSKLSGAIETIIIARREIAVILFIGSYRQNAIAIESEAGDSLT